MSRAPLLRRWLLAAVAACACAAPPVHAVAPLVEATLEPRQIAMGESAQLTITSSGSGMDALTLPVVSGLEFRVIGQSRRVEIIRGATLATTSIVVRVTPRAPGIFTIPGITPQSQPLVLRVNPDNGGSPAYGANPHSPIPPVVGGSADNNLHMTADGSAYIRLALPKRDVYVGESIPVEIEVGMRSGFVTSLNGLPTLTGNEFTLNNLSHQPERVERLIDGKPFTVLIWHSVLAPVKPGTFTLSVQTPLTVRVRVRSPKDSMIEDMLGDPFLQNFFGATVPKDITVSSPPADLTVVALPMDGRPADFAGAVGAFKIESDISSTTAAAGDPLTLRMHVTGSGNFDRVDSSMLQRLDQWKTYPPKSTFKAADAIGYKGAKTFEQPLIALRPGTQTVPGLSFSYFDPATHRYETAHSPALSVTIVPSLADSTQAAPPGPAAASNGAPGAPGAPAQTGATGSTAGGLRPDHAASDSVAQSLIPLFLQPRFLVLPSVLALLFAGGWAGLRRRTEGSAEPGSSGRTLSKAAGRVLTQMDAAARAGDAALFFNSARAGVQQTLAARWQVAPERITATDIDARLGIGGAEIGRLFALADEANYSGVGLTTPDFDRWTQIVRRELLDGKTV